MAAVVLPSEMHRIKSGASRIPPSGLKRRKNARDLQSQPPWLPILLQALSDSNPSKDGNDDVVKSENASVRIYQASLMRQLRQSTMGGDDEMISSISAVNNRAFASSKSGATWWVTQDKKFLFKSVPSNNVLTFAGFASRYVHYVLSNAQRTALVNIFGAYTIQVADDKYHIVLMQYLTPSGNIISEHAVSGFYRGIPHIHLQNRDVCNGFLTILEKDMHFLKTNCLVDYSLLIFRTSGEVVVGLVDFLNRRTVRGSLMALLRRPSWTNFKRLCATPCLYRYILMDCVATIFCKRGL